MKHTTEHFDVEAPSHLDMLVGMVRKTSDEGYTGWLQSMSVRMPMVLFCTMEALAQYSGQPRSKIVIKALEAAFDQVWEQLPEEERKEIEKLRSVILTHKMSQHEANPQATESGEA